MPVFKSADELYELIGGLFDWARTDPNISTRMRQTNLVLKLNYREPEAVIVIDCSRDPISWSRGAPDAKGDVEFSMKADVAHKFWRGKVNLVVALAMKEITAKGPVTKIMGLLPILKPMYGQYERLLREKGREDLLK